MEIVAMATATGKQLIGVKGSQKQNRDIIWLRGSGQEYLTTERLDYRSWELAALDSAAAVLHRRLYCTLSLSSSNLPLAIYILIWQ
ncbi:unnamed protein product [Nezara viridula]|uniref:Uncharacterized protein n=1 Tax=Nezara viridula TaxID=85310 RepID=A0A9P0MIV6_NEZVI|nr:unnamed protein product [Nezara viridula]